LFGCIRSLLQTALTIIRKLISTGQEATPNDDNDAQMSNNEPNPFPAHNPTHAQVPTLALCDDRLKKLNIGFWTSVPIPSSLAAKVVSLYLETDHPLLGPFDPDMFLADLVECKTNYCSGMLVSAIMYWGCVGD
jgi:hypothetical protein